MITKSASRTDAKLLQAAKTGDRRALDALVARYEPRIYRFSFRLTGNADDAADVSQDTLMAMARSLGSFRGDASLATWLYSVARRFAIKRSRQRARLLARETPIDAVDDGERGQLPSPDPSPEELAAARERDVVINAALAHLKPADREVLVLRDIEGLTAPETASTLGIGVRAVKSRLHRARLRLRSDLGPLLTPDAQPTGKPGCRDIVEQFSRSLAGELGAATCAELEVHLKGCRGCRSECASLKKVLAVCRQTPKRGLPAALKRSLQHAVRQARDETSRTR